MANCPIRVAILPRVGVSVVSITVQLQFFMFAWIEGSKYVSINFQVPLHFLPQKIYNDRLKLVFKLR